MFSYIRGPVTAAALAILFLGFLSYQNPLTFNTGSGVDSLTLNEVAAGCQAPVLREVDDWDDRLPDEHYDEFSIIPDVRINNVDSAEYYSGLNELAEEGNILVIYDREIKPQDYQILEEEVLAALSESLIPLYLIPHYDSEWGAVGSYEIYSAEVRQECVVGSRSVLEHFSEY